MTIFDLPASTAAQDLQQWQPILNWIRPTLYPPQAANDGPEQAQTRAVAKVPAQAIAPRPSVAATLGARALNPAPAQKAAASRLGSSLPGSLMPAQESLVHGARMSAQSNARAVGRPVQVSSAPAMTRNVNSPDGLQIPQFLKRGT
jgi:chromosome partitioning protein